MPLNDRWGGVGLICNAKSKRSGEKCKNMAVRGMTKCRIHGGKTPKKKLVIDGNAPKYLTKKEVTKLHLKLLNAPNLLDMREEIALLQTQLQKAIDRDAENQELIPIIREIRNLIKDYKTIEEGKKVTITINEIRQYIGLVAVTIKKHIPDLGIQRRIIEDLAKLEDNLTPDEGRK